MNHDLQQRVERAFVALLWSQFAAGRPLRCLREEHGTLAVSITQGVPHAYQLRCSHCAWHSEWFFVEGGRLRSMQSAPTRRHL